jgi:hypothetical protein
MGLLKGNELEKQFSDSVKVIVDVTPELKVKATVEVDLIAEAKKLAAKTETPIDDKAIEWLEKITKAASDIGV